MTSTLADLSRPFLEAHPTPHSLALRFGEVAVRVETNSGALAAALRDYFREFPGDSVLPAFTVRLIEAPAVDLGLAYVEKKPEPGKERVKEEYLDVPGGRVVRKRLTGMVFLFGDRLNLGVGPCLANANQAVNFINNRYIELLLKRGCLLGHAAGVALAGKGLAIAGFAGMGKSTLAMTLMRDPRMTFVSNDRLMVETRGGPDGADTIGAIMHGVAKAPRVNPGTVLNNDALAPVMTAEDRKRFCDLPIDELWKLEHKYDVFIDRCFGPSRFHLSAPMRGLALLNWKRDGSPFVIRRIDPSERRDLLPAFMKDVGLFFENEGDGMSAETETPLDFSEDAYVRLLSQVEVFELTGGVDFAQAARALVNWLETATLG